MSALPAACNVRAPIRMSAVGASAASVDAPRNMSRPIWKARLRPHRSPSFPARSSRAANVTL